MALSLRSPSLGVTQHPALWSPDFPRLPAKAGIRDYPTCSPCSILSAVLRTVKSILNHYPAGRDARYRSSSSTGIMKAYRAFVIMSTCVSVCPPGLRRLGSVAWAPSERYTSYFQLFSDGYQSYFLMVTSKLPRPNGLSSEIHRRGRFGTFGGLEVGSGSKPQQPGYQHRWKSLNPFVEHPDVIVKPHAFHSYTRFGSR